MTPLQRVAVAEVLEFWWRVAAGRSGQRFFARGTFRADDILYCDNSQ